jgi:hypothetical protein
MDDKDKDKEKDVLEEKTKEVEGKLVDAGVRQLRLRDGEVFAATVKDGVATIVTTGGHKVRFDEKGVSALKPLHPLHAGRSIKPPAPPPAEQAP